MKSTHTAGVSEVSTNGRNESQNSPFRIMNTWPLIMSIRDDLRDPSERRQSTGVPKVFRTLVVKIQTTNSTFPHFKHTSPLCNTKSQPLSPSTWKRQRKTEPARTSTSGGGGGGWKCTDQKKISTVRAGAPCVCAGPGSGRLA